MLTAKILNTQASLNNFKLIGSLDFMLGDAFRMAFRILDPQLGDRFVTPSTAIVTLTFNNADNTTFQKIAVNIDPLDRSMFYVDLASVDTAQLLGGNVSFSVDLLGDQTQLVSGIIYNPLRRIVTDCSC